MENQPGSRFEPSLLEKRFSEARASIEALSREAGRTPPRLLAVTKTVPADAINYAIDHLGVTAIGENRVQELLEKYDALHTPPDGKLEIHLIGSLQTNKVRYIVDKVDMIESLDSLKLAAEIERQAAKIGRVMDVLIEVNIGEEPQKGGVLPDELEAFALQILPFEHLRLRGLMTIAPKSDSFDDYLKYFSKTSALFLDISQKIVHNSIGVQFDVLSMGMSGSFPAAIRCGSTELRLGSTLFGSRPVPVSD